ncbi:TonB-dependent receptor [Novimethylophilus kurashikiensis]|uniref:TonB-dependent receptor n=1 Tax=Novimethylophilus kurashikiensis TaxID=1825523 RepID=A0A2R5F9D0_9PROT|nr:hypothetical protein [Novimethylophilus kurashikiensis]GBG14840.1 TonB-dependent receptor [Novimethylophilus kurashikiensis]
MLLNPELVKEYAAHGLTVTALTEGSPWFNHRGTMVVAEHDGVQYVMDCHGDLRNVEENVIHRKLIIERHHTIVKQMYEFCTSLNVGGIWVLCGGGTQLQAFFGNDTGYLGVLYLSMVTTQPRRGRFTFNVNFSKNDQYFDGKPNLPGIRIVLHRDTED